MILALLSAALLFGAAADSAETQEATLPPPGSQPEPPDARAEIFGGAGASRTDTTLLMRQIGANVWMTRHWGVSISHWSWTGYPTGGGISLFSIRYRLKLYDGRTELHAGASPVQLSIYRTGSEIETVPVFDVFVGRRIHRRFGVRFGLAVGVGEGAFLQPTGLAFWSFD